MTNSSDYSEDVGYVNIHGRDVRVYVCEKTGRILVPIDELKGMGFRLYRKSQYSKLLIDENQFDEEFNLYMLQAAQTYMFENKIAFNKNQIIECINMCKSTLTQQKTGTPKVRENIAAHRKIECNDDSIQITAIRDNNSSRENSFQGFTKIGSPGSVVRNGIGISNSMENTNSTFKVSPQKMETIQTNIQRNFNELRMPLQKPEITSFPKVSETTTMNRQKLDFKESKGSMNSETQLEVAERIPSITLDKPEHEVLISCIDAQKPNVLWVQDVDKLETLLDISTKIEQEMSRCEKKLTNFTLNTVYLASDEGIWCRCKVIKFKPLTVFFLDYGNIAQVTEVREASKEISLLPGQAIRIVHHELKFKPVVQEQIHIRIKNKYDNGTYNVDIITPDAQISSPPKIKNNPPTSFIKSPPESKNNPTAFTKSQPETKKLATFFTKPQPLCSLRDGDKILITSKNEGKLALRTKECYDSLKEIEIALDEEVAKAKPVDNVKIGQLVLCPKDKKLQRGVVLSIRGSTAEIELLDYYEKINIDVSKLKAISESLAKRAITLIVTPVIKNYDASGDKIIQELIDSRVKGIVVLSNGEFDVKLGNELLSEKLKPPRTDSNRLMLKDLDVFKPELGLGEYILNVYNNKDDLYFALGEALEEHLDSVIKTDLEDDKPYQPIVGEVCIGLYQDNWCRCVVTNMIRGQFQVSFIDFGNVEVLTTNELRKIDETMKGAPVLAFHCKLTGLPAKGNLEELLKQRFCDAESYVINIKQHDGKKYHIEVPSIYKEL